MSKVINHKELSPTLSMSECTDGFWLYDDTRGMNLAMREKTEEAAYIKALEYYQRRLQEVESNYKSLKSKVDHFVGQVVEEEEDHYCERCGSYS
ncbi:Phi92_gp225 [Escherichia phage phi92]|uniref:Phi92_gp225 n=1 Tax=Escherichia phage phi92 TaxID=948870 RepID=I7I041_9CAUD|nr:Phi92_gp225 [Escherichia phage phi92]CBY99654.1 Phi92_gp225 [Escherichia phage phi92]